MKMRINPNELKTRDTFIRDLRHTHIAYVQGNGKAYNRKKLKVLTYDY